MIISLSDRVAFVGKTGSGKSFLARAMHSNAKRLIVFDPKNELKRSWDLVDWNEGIKELRKGNYARVHVPPVFGNTREVSSLYDEYFSEILSIGNVIVFIDEINSITGGSHVIPSNMNMLFTMGRGLNISMRVCTQRPANVPVVLLSEADHYFVFRLQTKDDRKKVGNLIGIGEVPIIMDRHGYYYMDALNDKLIYIKELETS